MPDDAILDARRGRDELQLREHLTVRLRNDPAQSNEGRAADGVNERVHMRASAATG